MFKLRKLCAWCARLWWISTRNIYGRLEREMRLLSRCAFCCFAFIGFVTCLDRLQPLADRDEATERAVQPRVESTVVSVFQNGDSPHNPVRPNRAKLIWMRFSGLPSRFGLQ
jgi:hypothetical protein